MYIGTRILDAEVMKKADARETYEKAKTEGRSASLLEQERPNVFQMSVANIMPSDTIIVELRYTELLIPTDGLYEFVYPTVVGPRYVSLTNAPERRNESYNNQSYQHEGKKPLYKFDGSVTINAGYEINEVFSPSHKVIANKDENSSSIQLDSSESFGGNRDFILKYRLAGDKIQTGLLLSENGKEKFFMLMLQPPKRVEPDQIPPREYIFVIDVSGSMHGFPLDISKKLIGNLLSGMRAEDRFNIMLFSGANELLACQSMPATQEFIDYAVDAIDKRSGSGGTELLPALKRALKLDKTDGYSRSFVILTDGYVSVEEEAINLIRNELGDANFFSFGIGKSVNRFIIEGIARAGLAESFIVTNPELASAEAAKFQKYIQSPVMTNIKVKFNGFDAYDFTPEAIPDVLADRPILLYGKWKGSPYGDIVVSGYAGKEHLAVKIPITTFATFDTSNALKYLWARNKIAVISDYNTIANRKARVDEITNLGLKYNLLTNYTSFVAVDYEIRNNGKKTKTVRQPLPLPEGVSDNAVEYSAFAAAQSVNPLTIGSGGMQRKSERASSSRTIGVESKTMNVAVQSEVDNSEINKHAISFKELNTYSLDSSLIGLKGKLKVIYNDNDDHISFEIIESNNKNIVNIFNKELNNLSDEIKMMLLFNNDYKLRNNLFFLNYTERIFEFDVKSNNDIYLEIINSFDKINVKKIKDDILESIGEDFNDIAEKLVNFKVNIDKKGNVKVATDIDIRNYYLFRKEIEDCKKEIFYTLPFYRDGLPIDTTINFSITFPKDELSIDIISKSTKNVIENVQLTYNKKKNNSNPSGSFKLTDGNCTYYRDYNHYNHEIEITSPFMNYIVRVNLPKTIQNIKGTKIIELPLDKEFIDSDGTKKKLSDYKLHIELE